MKKLVLSMMSGTSLDGIDILFGEIEGSQTSTKVNVLHTKTYAYDPKLMEKIKDAISQKKSTSKLICSLNIELAKAYSKCVFAFCKEFEIDMNQIDFLASHGQTIYHIPKDEEDFVQSSLQLGDGSVLANLIKIPVVSNFRTADIALGGHGAPLVPYANYVLFSDKNKSRILQNIGGIANLTYLRKGASLDDVIAFDNGPGNMMIDYAMQKLYQRDYDEDGKVAKQGYLIKAMFDEIIAHPYFHQKPPKTTGRETFGKEYCDQLLNKYKAFDNADIITTLTHISAYAIGKSYEWYCKDYQLNDEIILSGGGAYNQTLVDLIAFYSQRSNVYLLEDFGYSSNYYEALAFMVLANETLEGKPSNVPSATGASDYVILGQISPVRR